MSTNPYEPPKEVGTPLERSSRLHWVFLDALGFGASMVVGAVCGVPFFIGLSSSHMENVQQLATGLIVGAVVGGIAYQAMKRSLSR